MTLPSRRKRQITAPSIRHGITGNAGWLAGSLCLLCLTVLTVNLPLTAEENPLDHLQNRSAETRWKSLRERLAERREERKDRKKLDETEKPNAGKGKADLDADAAELAEQALPQPAIPLPANTGRVSMNDLVAPPVLPLPGEPSRQLARDDAPPALVPMPHVPAPAPQVLEVKQTLPATAVARAAKAAEPLYQELFQLEVTPVPGLETPDQNSKTALLPPADPHPGLLDPKSNPYDHLPARPVSQQRSIAQATPAPGLALPELPLPRPAEFRVAQQNQQEEELDQLLAPFERRVPRNELVFNADEYIKPIHDITPFRDYEPNRQLRESDPYRNLCDDPRHAPRPNEQCPIVEDIPGEEGIYQRDFAHLDFHWAASNIHYYPLYFQDVSLERYGHSHHPLVQPFVSVGKFSGQFLALPYSMTMAPPRMKTYPLGYLPPGDVGNPKLYYQVPFNAKAAMVTAGVYTGWVFLIP